MIDTQRLTNYYIARANDELRARLAETTAQLAEATRMVEWLSKENAVLRRNNAELIPELRDLSKKAEAFVASTQAEIAKWKAEAELATEWYKSYKYQAETNRQWIDKLLVKLENAERENRRLRKRVAFLEKVLHCKPGTMYFGIDGFYLRGVDEESDRSGHPVPPREIVDAVRSLRMEHFHNDEDRWFSCPKSGECANDAMPTDMCTCGADTQNATVDRILAYLMRGTER